MRLLQQSALSGLVGPYRDISTSLGNNIEQDVSEDRGAKPSSVTLIVGLGVSLSRNT